MVLSSLTHKGAGLCVGEMTTMTLRNHAVIWLAAILAVALYTCVGAAPACATTILRIRADYIAFYYDWFSIRADGNVRVDLGNGASVLGQTLFINLRTDRLVIAGNVQLAARGTTQDGAALAIPFAEDRAYFIARAPAPERWTYTGFSFTSPAKSVSQPADAFVLPDFRNSAPIVLAKDVTVGLRSFMRFGLCRVAPVGGVRVYVPLPSLYIGFSKDPNLSQTTLGAATAGATIKLTGNTNAASALALNYSATTKFGVGFQQNIVWNKGWSAFSLFPVNQKSPFLTAIVTDAPSQTFGLQGYTLVNSYPSGGSLPSSAAQFNYFQLTQSLHDAYLQLNYQFGSSNLLAPPPIPSAYNSTPFFGPAHPSSVQLGLSSSTFWIGRTLEGYLRGGYIYQHNGDGLQHFGGVSYATIWSSYAGISLATPRLELKPNLKGDAPYFVIEAAAQREWNSVPHYVDQREVTASLTRPLSVGFVTASYMISNVKDVYGAAQREAYPVLAPPQDPGYAAFEGFATFRTLSLGFVYAPNPFFAFSITGQQNTNFPEPSPILFTPVQTTVLGVNPVSNYLGAPPYALPVKVRFRVNPSLSLNVAGTYYFNYFGNQWNNLQVQFLP